MISEKGEFMITVKQKGSFNNFYSMCEKSKEIINLGKLEEYGRRGVEALAEATPKNSGSTASSWKYEITRTNNSASLNFYNTNEHNGVPIAIILQYGHATKNGGWVEGMDYINPAIQPIFEELADELWKEVSK